MKRKLLPICLLALCSLWVLPSVSKANSCWSGPVSHVSFGNVGPRGGTAIGSISAVCQKTWSSSIQTTHFRVCLTIPPGAPINTISPRSMGNYRGGVVKYDLYSDPAHTMPITSTLSGTVYTTTHTIRGSGSPQATIAMPVYARVPVGQAAPEGSYISQNYANIHWVASTDSMPPASACMGGSTINGIYQSTTAQWENSCAIIAANDLGFGVRPNVQTAVSSQSSVSITCPVGTPWQVSLGRGENYAGSTRRMRHVSQNSWLNYALFQNPARTTPWGWTLGRDTRTGTGTGSAQVLPVYGTVPAQPVSVSGVYQDNVQVLLTY